MVGWRWPTGSVGYRGISSWFWVGAGADGGLGLWEKNVTFHLNHTIVT